MNYIRSIDVLLSSCGPAFCFFAASGLYGIPLEEVEDIQWVQNVDEDGFEYSWQGQPSHYYFVEMSPDLSPGSWSFFPYATKGNGSETGAFISLSPDHFFFRLRYTSDVNSPLLTGDFNANGFSNRDEMDMGIDPFGSTDTNENGIPDAIEAFWAQVPQGWKLALIEDPNANFYDPENQINSIEGVLPGDDYDGDGRSNLREYLDGTDPADFFNGDPAYLYALGGDSQTATPGALMEAPLHVSVANSKGLEWTGAPLRFAVNGGHSGLITDPASSERHDSIRLIHPPIGSSVQFEAPQTIGTSTVTASLPDGKSLTFTLYTVDTAAKARQGVTNLASVDNEDGTFTYTWEAGPAAGDFFKLVSKQPNGTWQVFYETTYGSAELPLAPGQTEFSLTITKE